METTNAKQVPVTKRAEIRMDVWIEADSICALRSMLAQVTRSEMLSALKENDPNGLYLDECQEEGDPPVTREEAIDLVIDVWRDAQTNDSIARPDSESEIEEARDAALAQLEDLEPAKRAEALRAALAIVEAQIDPTIAAMQKSASAEVVGADLAEKAEALQTALHDVAQAVNEASVVDPEHRLGAVIERADWEAIEEALGEWQTKSEEFLKAVRS